MSYVRKRGSVDEPPPPLWGIGGCAWADEHPFLAAFLSKTTYEDSSPRKTGTLLVFVDQGALKACLSDRDVSEVAFISSGSFEALLDALEQGLREGELEWRKAGGGAKRRR